jgi:hypothetical protein
MPSIEYDLRYLRAALVDLEGYLFSQEIYWPVGVTPPHGDPPYPRLTMGGILLSRKSLEARPMEPAQAVEMKELIHRLDETKLKWQVAWGTKAARSFSSRLNQWKNFIEEYRKEPGNNQDRYAYEVRGRTMLQLLQPETNEIPPGELELLAGLDLILADYFLEGSFVWGSELTPCFPTPQFYYLYGRLGKQTPSLVK